MTAIAEMFVLRTNSQVVLCEFCRKEFILTSNLNGQALDRLQDFPLLTDDKLLKMQCSFELVVISLTRKQAVNKAKS